MTRLLHGAAQFWRGGAFVALLMLGGFLYAAYTLPEVYESDALVELTNERGSDASAAAADGLRAAVFDPRTIEQLALDTTPHVQRDGDKPGPSLTDRTRRAIDLRPTGDARFTLAYRAATAALARHGCDSLIAAASQRLTNLHPPSSVSPQEEARQRARIVEERTRELASFVAQHPELAGKKNEGGEAFLGVPGMRPPSTPAPAPTTDAVLPILLQQKARLEERIAYVEKVELGGAEDTEKLASSDTLAKMDRASLQKMLVQVKAAIAARQAAAERARANAPSENPLEGTASTAEPASPTPVQAEWQRLVQAVVDAQQQAAQGRESAAGLHVVRAAGTPSSPISPNRRLFALLGVTVGLWTGLLWAFARFVLGHAPAKPTQYLPEGLPAFPLEGEVAAVPAESTSASRLAAAKAVAPTTPVPVNAAVAAAPTSADTPATSSPETLPLAKTAALPSFPMDADSAKAADEATSASRVSPAKVVPAVPVVPATPPAPKVTPTVPVVPVTPPAPKVALTVPVVPPTPAAAKSAPTPVPPPVALAATMPAHAVVSPAVEAKREALPSFPIDAELAKALDEATSASRPAPARPVSDMSNLPKVIIAPEATVPSAAKSSALPSFPMEAEPVPAPVASKGLPVFVVEGEKGAPAAERSPYAAVAEAARSVSGPHHAEPASGGAGDARRPSRHPSWYAEPPAAQRSSRPAQTVPKPEPAEEGSIKPQPIAAVGAPKIEASPIMGIEEGMSTAASGKQGISVYPPPVAAAAGDSASPSRKITQTMGMPTGVSASTAPSYGWTPHAGFGAHQMPPRESDPPPGLASIPPPPKPPTHVGALPIPIFSLGSSRPAPAVQSLPITPGRGVAAAEVPEPTVEEPSTALALVRPHSTRTRSEPPAASSVVCDVPKGWAPHPTLIESDASQELAALRDQLYRLAARECFVVGVSSGPEMAAYKSGVAGRLAWMLAQPGHARVLFMEGDFDHPVVHRLMRIDMPIAAGFSEQMRRRMNGSPPGPWTIVRCAPNLYVLAEGLVRSPGLLPTVHFADSVNELRRAYDLIVIDGPAGGMNVDTRALDSVADGIVLAGEAGLLDRASSWFGKKQLMAVVSGGHPEPRSR